MKIPTVNDKLADALEERLGVRPDQEHKFTTLRRWSVDLVFPEQKLAIEVDGSSHYRAAGHRRDCEKGNALIEEGWRLIRYPASSVLTQKRITRIVDQIERILSGVTSPEEYRNVLTQD